MRLRKRPPFNATEAARPVCESIDELIRSTPEEYVLEVLDEIIAYGEGRFSYVKNALAKQRIRK